MKAFALLIAALAAGLLCGCSSTRTVRLYAGAERPADELAILTVPGEVVILSLDRFEAPRISQTFVGRTRRYEIPAGKHTLRAQLSAIVDLGRDDHKVVESDPVTVNFSAAPGMAYRLDYEDPASNAGDGMADVRMWILEVGVAVVPARRPVADSSAPDDPDPPRSSGTEGVDPADMLRYWWNEASPEQRREFQRWITDGKDM